ncbi:MAG: glycosyltransferase family 2 protein [Candidatus Omnitrophica bacterium]|nr:glycosyltransferase family 2 protein [Candidatus Omnitrophota bacterium]
MIASIGTGKAAPDISILIPTYNRCESLKRTLLDIADLEKGDFSWEVVAIDNNSTDSTGDLLSHLQNRMPLRKMFVASPGKNAALNAALERGGLGEIVVFTDDDITPAKDWLVRVWDSTRRRPCFDIFGGPIEIGMPSAEVPKWTEDRFIRKIAFAENLQPRKEHRYRDHEYPFGGNYWIRRHLIEKGYRFDERLGPKPRDAMLGDEISFLRGLRRDGYEILHIPSASVTHRLQENSLTLENLSRRIKEVGRSHPHIWGNPDPHLFETHPKTWMTRSLAGLARNTMRLGWASLSFNPDKRVERRFRPSLEIASSLESFQIFWKSRKARAG